MKVTIGKLATKTSKLLGNRGTDISGRVVVKIDKNALVSLAKKIDVVILVTGTNGKTTTTNIIASVIEQLDVRYIHNREGANLYTGVVSAIINEHSSHNKQTISYGIFEVDEGSVPRVMNDLDKGYLVINNFFRDQLDRYSEIDMLIEKIKKGIKPSFKLIINSDDPFCARFNEFDVTGFGLSNEIDAFKQGSVTDSRFCPDCKKELVYSKSFYSQLGHYTCDCGFTRLDPKYVASNISQSHVIVNGITYKHNIVGAYNSYNILAAISLLKELGINDETIQKGLDSYKSTDGRMQLFNINDHHLYLNLVKNPSGMNSSINEAKSLNIKNISFVLNDLEADGRDISWIWDCDLEDLLDLDLDNYFVSGQRAEEMALRLKNMGVETSKIIVNSDFQTLLPTIIKGDTLIVCSYTALNKTKITLEKQVR